MLIKEITVTLIVSLFIRLLDVLLLVDIWPFSGITLPTRRTNSKTYSTADLGK